MSTIARPAWRFGISHEAVVRRFRQSDIGAIALRQTTDHCALIGSNRLNWRGAPGEAKRRATPYR